MAQRAAFVTSEGWVFHSSTQRKYIVVDQHDGRIEYRTDMLEKALARANKSRRFVVAKRQEQT